MKKEKKMEGIKKPNGFVDVNENFNIPVNVLINFCIEIMMANDKCNALLKTHVALVPTDVRRKFLRIVCFGLFLDEIDRKSNRELLKDDRVAMFAMDIADEARRHLGLDKDPDRSINAVVFAKSMPTKD